MNKNINTENEIETQSKTSATMQETDNIPWQLNLDKGPKINSLFMNLDNTSRGEQPHIEEWDDTPQSINTKTMLWIVYQNVHGMNRQSP